RDSSSTRARIAPGRPASGRPTRSRTSRATSTPRWATRATTRATRSMRTWPSPASRWESPKRRRSAPERPETLTGKDQGPYRGHHRCEGRPGASVLNQMTAHAITAESAALPSTRDIARKLAVVAGLLAIGAVVATQLPGLTEIGHQLAGADAGWIAVAAILELLSTAAFALAFHGVYDRRPSPRASTSMSLAVQGLNIVLPSGGAGGLAVGAVLLDRAGVPRSRSEEHTSE